MKEQSPRRVRMICAVAVTALLVIAGCSANKGVGDRIDDGWITSKVKAKMAADPAVNAFEIDVDSSDGVVRLSGTVETEKQRSEAVEIAKNTDGVVRVVDDIELGDPTFAQNVENKAIVAKIKAKFTGDPEINPFNIDVDSVRNGEVTLSGKVDDAKTRDEAERLARNTTGVISVTNRIQLKNDDRTAMDDEDRYGVELWDADDRMEDSDVADDYNMAAEDLEMTDRYGDRREGVTGTDRTGTGSASVGSQDYDNEDLPSVHARVDTAPEMNDHETILATVVSTKHDLIVIDTDEGRREIRISDADDRPENLVAGERIAVTFHEEDGRIVAMRLGEGDEQPMTYASPTRSTAAADGPTGAYDDPTRRDQLPATASPQHAYMLIGMLLLAGGALLRTRRPRI